jgi:GTP-binding protein HflX
MFATLDPSSRRMRFPNDREVLFVDTVGFIRELPKELLNAFRATLEEVREADLILHLVDATNSELRRQIEVVDGTLDSLGLESKPRLLVLNKVDLLSEPELAALENSLNALAISAVKRIGFESLIGRIQEEMRESFSGLDPGNFLAAES